MKSILLIGLGRFGLHIASKLSELGHQVMAVDKSEERINRALSFVTSAQIGDSTDEDFIQSLGVSNFDCCIVAIGDDFQNSLETTSLLKDKGAVKVIARATKDTQEKFLLKCGADEVVYPEKQLASWTAIRCTSEHILDYIQLDSDYSIFELDVPREWTGKTVLELDVRKRYNINILGIRREGKLMMDFSPDMLLEERDSIYVLGRQKVLHKYLHI